MIKLLVIIAMLLVIGCQDKGVDNHRRLLKKQALFACKEKGGVFKQYNNVVKCNNGAMINHYNIELPKHMWVSNE